MVFRDDLGSGAEAIGNNFKNGTIQVGRHFLVELTNAQTWNGFDLARVWLNLAVDDAQQCGLALTITAN